MNGKIKKIGQISIMVALIGATATVLVSTIGGYFTANSKVSAIDKDMTVIKITEELHYKELTGKIDALDKKLDKKFDELKELLK